MKEQKKLTRKIKKNKKKNTRKAKIFKNKLRLINKYKKKEEMPNGDVNGSLDFDINNFMKHKGLQYFSLSLYSSKKNIIEQLNGDININEILRRQAALFQIQNYNNCRQQVLKYIRKVIISQKSKLMSVGLNKKDKKSLKINMLYLTNNSLNNYLILSQQQFKLFKKRKRIIQAIKTFINQFKNKDQNQNFNFPFQEQICTLYKINKQTENEVQAILSSIEHKNQQQQKFRMHFLQKQSSEDINNQYIKVLIIKNINKTINFHKINLISYFAIKQKQEAMLQDKNADISIQNIQSFRKFTQIHRFKCFKNKRKLLATACGGCLSNYCQIYNPMRRCAKCGIRFHKFCQKSNRKCLNCSNDKKKLSCIICLQSHEKYKGLLFEQIIINNQQKFAHIFCLLTHTHWKIQNQLLQYHINPQPNIKSCNICNKQSIFYVQKQQNNTCYHAICAYFKGYQLKNQNNIISIKNNEASERLQFIRKYILNYQGLIYQKNIFQLILKYNQS